MAVRRATKAELKAVRNSNRTSFGYDFVVWHQDCPSVGDSDKPSPRFVATAQPKLHKVGEHCKNADNNRDSGGVSLFCENCPAWITIGIHEARPKGQRF